MCLINKILLKLLLFVSLTKYCVFPNIRDTQILKNLRTLC